MSKIILDLCGGTGAWSQPYQEAGYDVRIITLPKVDVRDYDPPKNVYGILAAPPCTEFAVSGARWWKTKPKRLLTDALAIVQACFRIIDMAEPWWWALENPVGRLPDHIGPYKYTFQPWEYGDPWLKRTCVWGKHTQPMKRPCPKPNTKTQQRWRVSLTNHLSPTPTAEQIATLVRTGMIPPDWRHRLGPSPDRATLRSLTPPGFARAFFVANP